MKTPLYFINGKLGCGKTTILGQILVRPQFRGSSIIENEIASQDFDGHKLASTFTDSAVTQISGECICCSDPEGLVNIALALRKKRPNAAIIIESTGVASALQLITKLVSSDNFDDYFEIKQLIYVVDALAIRHGATSAHDVLLADIVVVTKFDLVNESEQQINRHIAHSNVVIKLNKNDSHFFDSLSHRSAYKERLLQAMEANSRGMQVTHEPFTKIIRLPVDVVIEPAELHRQQQVFGIDRIKGLILSHAGLLMQYDATRYHYEATKASWQDDPYLVVITDDLARIKGLQKWLNTQ